MVDVYFTKLKAGARIPTKHDEDAGYDIYACFDEDFIIIKPGEIKIIPTGIASAFSSDYFLRVLERSSCGIKGMSLRAGVIDSGYRGEHLTAINNTGLKPIIIAKNPLKFNEDEFIIHDYKKAIAQYVLLPVPKTKIRELSLEELKKFDSKRGEGGFGSSGK
jgi:dUTP pyrophosphatase